jgi:outer membrane protein TolC
MNPRRPAVSAQSVLSLFNIRFKEEIMFARTLSFLLLLNLPCFAAGRPAIPPVLTLREAIDIALANNPGLRAAEERARQSEERVRAAHKSALPQVDFNTYQNGQTDNLRAYGFGASSGLDLYPPPFATFDSRLNVTYNLWDPARRRREQAARLDADAGVQETAAARENLIGDVTEAYLAARYSRKVERALEHHASLAENLLKLAEDRYARGVGSALEANRASQEVRRVRLLQVDAAASFRQSKMALARLLNADPRSAFDLSDEAAVNMPAPSAAEAIERALASRAGYRALETRIAAAEAEAAAVRARRLPTVQVHVDSGFSGDSPVRGIVTWRALGSLQFPLFRGEQSAETAEAEAKVRELQSTAAEMQAAIETEVSIASSEIDAARQKVELAGEIRDLASQELDLASKRFATGITDNLEVIAAQDRSLRAEEDLARIQTDLLRAITGLYRKMGHPELPR